MKSNCGGGHWKGGKNILAADAQDQDTCGGLDTTRRDLQTR
jgi:hypothetical protein